MLVTAYRNGLSVGSPPPPRDHSEDAKRAAITGWSRGAVRRHTKWLYSVDAGELEGAGFALTLTVKTCPDSASDWRDVLHAFFSALERAGCVRLHWVIEWQRRGVPHLHCAAYFPEALPRPAVVQLVLGTWLRVAALYEPNFRAQTVDEIAGALGWLQYLSKHAARGVGHYQRQGKPAGWEKTGRLWGYRGTWPTFDPMKFDISTAAGHRFRRLTRSWRVADARAALQRQLENPVRDPELQASKLRAARRRVAAARRSLACSDPKLSAVRGVSEWIPEDVSAALVMLLVAEGHLVVQRSEASDGE